MVPVILPWTDHHSQSYLAVSRFLNVFLARLLTVELL